MKCLRARKAISCLSVCVRSTLARIRNGRMSTLTICVVNESRAANHSRYLATNHSGALCEGSLKPKPPLESVILRQIMAYLRFKGIFHFRVNTQGVMRKGRYTRSPNIRKGVADLI